MPMMHTSPLSWVCPQYPTYHAHAGTRATSWDRGRPLWPHKLVCRTGRHAPPPSHHRLTAQQPGQPFDNCVYRTSKNSPEIRPLLCSRLCVFSSEL